MTTCPFCGIPASEYGKQFFCDNCGASGET